MHRRSLETPRYSHVGQPSRICEYSLLLNNIQGLAIVAKPHFRRLVPVTWWTGNSLKNSNNRVVPDWPLFAAVWFLTARFCRGPSYFSREGPGHWFYTRLSRNYVMAKRSRYFGYLLKNGNYFNDGLFLLNVLKVVFRHYFWFKIRFVDGFWKLLVI